MKKHFCAFLLCVMLLTALGTGAFADRIVNLGTTEAGIYYSRSLNDTVPENTLSLECDKDSELPDGLEIIIELNGGLRSFFLRGTPTTAGSCSFRLCAFLEDGTQQFISCALIIASQAPTVNAGPNVTCMQDEETQIFVSAKNPGSGSLSYQWYRSDTSNNVDGTALPGATGASYSPDTSKLGVNYYFCVVSNNELGSSVSATSALISVTVTEPQVSALQIMTLPDRVSYEIGESLQAEGLTLRAILSNGKERILTASDVNIGASAFIRAGEQQITVYYKGQSATFPVTVREESFELSILKYPDKMNYVVGETLDTKGMRLQLRSSRTGVSELNGGYTCSPTEFPFAGTQTVTVSYAGAELTFKITVTEKKTVSEARLLQLPEKMSYYLGEEPDLRGLTVSLSFTDGSAETRTEGFEYEPSRLETVGTQSILVHCGERNVSFTVKVLPAEDAPVPTAPAEPLPTAEVPVLTPAPTAAPGKPEPGSAFGGIVLAAAAALLALGGAAAYVLPKRKTAGKKQTKPKDYYDPKEFK